MTLKPSVIGRGSQFASTGPARMDIAMAYRERMSSEIHVLACYFGLEALQNVANSTTTCRRRGQIIHSRWGLRQFSGRSAIGVTSEFELHVVFGGFKSWVAG